MLNVISILGRLTRDPELRYTPSNVPVCYFTVAVDRDYESNGERPTDFIDCNAWRQSGEFIAKHFQKGSMIAVTGRLESRKWQDRDGNKRTSWEINVDHTYFGEPKRDGGQQSSYGGGYAPPAGGYSSPPPSGGYNAPPAQAAPPPQQQYQQGTFTELEDDDGELPF